MEVDFPPTFPFSPPFFRILKPRLLPFMQHGGGHVTSGLFPKSLVFRFIDCVIIRRHDVHGAPDLDWLVS